MLEIAERPGAVHDEQDGADAVGPAGPVGDVPVGENGAHAQEVAGDMAGFAG